MRYFLYLCTLVLLSSCFDWYQNRNTEPPINYGRKVWGLKPKYAQESTAKQITYISGKQPVYTAGNIYAFRNYLLQVDVGRGIHVIDNTDPATADRIGFIVVNGCSQLSIKGAYLYTNSLADLVTINISDLRNVSEVSRTENAFPELRYNYFLVQPTESGYYECPKYDSVVVGWERDSVYAACYKQ